MAAHGITGDAAFALRSQPAMSKPVMSPASSGWRWNRRAVIEQAKLPPVRAGAVTDTGGELQGGRPAAGSSLDVRGREIMIVAAIMFVVVLLTILVQRVKSVARKLGVHAR
jgi:hypothetical protein